MEPTMLTFNFNLTGKSEKVAGELVEAPTDSPETEIRKVLADFLTRQTDPDSITSVIVSVTISGF
jgi:hypothetical protein